MQKAHSHDARASSETHCHLQCFGHPRPLYSTPTFDQSSERWLEDPLTPQWSTISHARALIVKAFIVGRHGCHGLVGHHGFGRVQALGLVLELAAIAAVAASALKAFQLLRVRNSPPGRVPGQWPGFSAEKPEPGPHSSPHRPAWMPSRMTRGSTSGTSGIRRFHAPIPAVRQSSDETDGISAWCMPSCPTGGSCGCPQGAGPPCCGIPAASSLRVTPEMGCCHPVPSQTQAVYVTDISFSAGGVGGGTSPFFLLRPLLPAAGHFDEDMASPREPRPVSPR